MMAFFPSLLRIRAAACFPSSCFQVIRLDHGGNPGKGRDTGSRKFTVLVLVSSVPSKCGGDGDDEDEDEDEDEDSRCRGSTSRLGRGSWFVVRSRSDVSGCRRRREAALPLVGRRPLEH